MTYALVARGSEACRCRAQRTHGPPITWRVNTTLCIATPTPHTLIQYNIASRRAPTQTPIPNKEIIAIQSLPPQCSSTKTPPPYAHLNANNTRKANRTQLIAQCTTHFKLESDRASLLRISDSLSTLSTFRQQHLSSLHSTLSRLSRTHQTLSSNHAHTLSQHNPTTHAAEILKLDTEKFKIAKQASDLEMEGERLEGELGRLGGVLGELESEGVEGGEREKGPEEDATV